MRIIAAMALVVLSAACSKPAPPAAPAPAFDTTIPVHDLMEDVVEPNADAVWRASGSIVDAKGVHDLSPTTDAGWASVRSSAAVVAETGNLLLIPGRARPGKAWTAGAQRLTALGLMAMKAADARDKDALLRVGGELDDACDSCHAVYVLGEPAKP